MGRVSARARCRCQGISATTYRAWRTRCRVRRDMEPLDRVARQLETLISAALPGPTA
ncbi:hypothetical protein [Streptomyces sp. Ag109_O5-1]|uniref:hypothetical protein n=1 Tax=Streptomyces sp. Ag109_O5-1 TaxID=1938851 RepID=UPI001625529E|nr:hypothetical protein [Streptomyces sp. Ag109_O5-1]